MRAGRAVELAGMQQLLLGMLLGMLLLGRKGREVVWLGWRWCTLGRGLPLGLGCRCTIGTARAPAAVLHGQLQWIGTTALCMFGEEGGEGRREEGRRGKKMTQDTICCTHRVTITHNPKPAILVQKHTPKVEVKLMKATRKKKLQYRIACGFWKTFI